MPESFRKINPLVTIITVTYNSSLYVRDAVESVLAQDYTSFEYIIADDCSTDNTWDIIQEYKDQRIISYRNEVNLGEYQNRNKAICIAKGKYLIFIDGDDIIYPHAIGYFVNNMENHSEAVMCIQKGYVNNIVFPILVNPPDLILNHFSRSGSLLSSSFASNFFKTDILKKEGGLSNKYRTGDDEIRLRLAAQYPILLVQGWVTWPRETPGQSSSQLADGMGLMETYLMVSQNFSQISHSFLNSNIQEKISKHLKNALCKVIIRNLFKGNYFNAIQLKKKSGLKWTSILELKPSAPPDNFLDKYTPSKPLKQQSLGV